MKKYTFKKIFSLLGKSLMAFTLVSGMAACDNVIYDYEENCDPEPPGDYVDPNPAPQPGYIRIYVRSNPGSAGLSAVSEDRNTDNRASTEEGVYVSIDIKEGEPYTLKATESNPDYIFIGWHDDSNDGDLTPGRDLVANITSKESVRYTAMFQKVEEIEEPEPGYVRIYVRSNPGSGGTSSVISDEDPENTASTEEGLYVSIDIPENTPYTLAAIESNPEYKFVKWHDDTNNGDLTVGKTDMPALESEVSMRYTAIFEKVEEVEPGMKRVFVRVNQGEGGTAAVNEVADMQNVASTNEGMYVNITLPDNGAYTINATPLAGYHFVRWHDDTNDHDLSAGTAQFQNITTTGDARYTAIFEADDPDPDLQGYYVKYVFDKNMQFVDAFSQKVNSVDLYVFDNKGNFIQKYQENGEALKDAGYLMELTDLPAGTYEFIAWCGLNNNSGHFTVSPGVKFNNDVTCTMATANNVQSKNLNALFHGRIENATYVDKTSEKQIKTVYLTKNTNNINITLQHKDGLEFNKGRFEVTLSDNNVVMRHDNAMGSNQEVIYTPHRTVYGSTRSGGMTRADESTTGNYLQVELSTARLMEDNNPIIKVVDTENNNNVVFSIPLVKWATQLRSSQSKTQVPDDQEYLDREDNYNLMLWLDSKDGQGWFGAQVNINDWHVIDDSADAK